MQEHVIQPKKTLRAQDVPARHRAALKYAMICYPESVSGKTYEQLEEYQPVSSHQLRVFLGVSKKHAEEVTDESAKNGHAHEDETNPYYDIFTKRFVHWRDETGGVIPTTLMDTARDLRVHAQVLVRTGGIFLEQNPDARNKHL